MDRLQEILARLGDMGITSKQMSEKDWEQFKVDDWNKTPGN
jgi:hypothetical protein